MEEDNPTSKRSIFQFLLGREHWLELYKEFLRLKVEFFHAMGHQAWVTQELCEEVWPSGGGRATWGVGLGPSSRCSLPLLLFQIQAQNPHHWVWGRGRHCIP